MELKSEEFGSWIQYSSLLCASETIPIQHLQFSRTHCPDERCHCHQKKLLPWIWVLYFHWYTFHMDDRTMLFPAEFFPNHHTSTCWFSTMHLHAIISPRFQCTFHLIQEKVRDLLDQANFFHWYKSWLPDMLSGNSNFLPH